MLNKFLEKKSLRIIYGSLLIPLYHNGKAGYTVSLA